MKDKDITISFKNMIYRILLGWRGILVCAVVFALLGNFYGVYKDYEKIKSEKPSIVEPEDVLASAERKVKSLESNLSDKDVLYAYDAAETTRSLEEQFRQIQNYRENSLYMQVDFEHVPTAKLRYYIDAHPKTEYPMIMEYDYSVDIGRAYMEYLVDQEVTDYISEVYGIDEVYVRELFYYYITNNYLYIEIIGPDEEKCNIAKDFIKDKMNKLDKVVKKDFPSYDIFLVIDSFCYQVNDTVYDRQYKRVTELNTIRTSRGNILSGMTEDQKSLYTAIMNYYNLRDKYEQNPEDLIEPQTQKKTSKISFVHKKYTAAGLAGGIFVAVLLLAIKYIFTPVVRVKENLIVDLNQNVFGTIWPENSRKRFLGFVDKWITKAFYKRDMYFTFDKSVEMIAMGIRIAMEKENISKVYLTGSASDNMGVTDKLEADLKNGFEVEKGECIVYNPLSLKNLSDSEAVVFIEKAGDSTFDNILKEMDLAKQSKVKNLGFVLLQ